MEVFERKRQDNEKLNNDLELINAAIDAVENGNEDVAPEPSARPTRPGVEYIYPADEDNREENDTYEPDNTHYVVDPEQTYVMETLDGVVVQKRQCFIKFCGITIFDDTLPNKHIWKLILVGFIIFGCSATVISFLFYSSLPQKLKTESSFAPVESPSSLPSSIPIDPRAANITELLFEISGEQLLETNSSQNKALNWIIEEDPMNLTYDSANIVQRYALMVLFYGLRGEQWFNNMGYGSDNHECEWDGISCINGSPIRLTLNRNNLQGTLSKEIGLLSSLVRIAAEHNNIHGSIPKELCDLKQLETLMFFENRLSGTIPNEIGNCANLERISLHSNRLSGSIPSTLGKLRFLQHFHLDANKLTGTIPSEVSGMRSLLAFECTINLLTGTIPSEMASMVTLQHLYLSDNKLEGSIPNKMGNLENLNNLFVDENRLDGSIPSDLRKLSKLRNLYLSSNGLTGTIPDIFGSLLRLEGIGLNNNNLNGTIPSSLGKLDRLQNLKLHHNLLLGTVIEDICDLPLVALTSDCAVPSPKVNCSCCTGCF